MNKWKRLRAGSLPFTKVGRIAREMEKFIKRNGLYQFHHVTENGKKVERIDYYPTIWYKQQKEDNIFCIRIRMDGAKSEEFRNYEQELADMFLTVCTDIIEERGYLTYCFELCEQEQIRIESENDIMVDGSSEIVFSNSIKWNWRKCPHFLLAGNTSSGKTSATMYVITCLLTQGVRVIYCDPKNDDDMRLFAKNKPIVYLTKENEIAKAVREIEEEVRLREQDITKIGIEELEFPPVFLIFDELIAFSKIADKRTYEETMKRLGAIVVSGRSKRVYAGLILQRPDTIFIDGAVRDNLGLRIAMGKMSDTAYKMIFGSDFAHVKNYRNEIGSGLILRQGIDSKPREFLAPFICKGALTTE